ncbi:MAG: acyltransferase domain-containing protein [Chloroflexota bacterium]|nr:acyltransferase domain-containing protein [Chloroflexota bacterium]
MTRLLDAQAVRERLGSTDACSERLVELESIGPPSDALTLPSPDEARHLLSRLALPSRDVESIVASLPTPTDDPELWWLLERCHSQLVRDVGGFEPLPPWPMLPASLGERGRLFYVNVFLATLPAIRRWHEERGIPDEVSWATLADLGNQVDIHRWMYGSSGLETRSWLTLHFRGGIYRLGRLQFNRSRMGPAPGRPPLFWYDAVTVDRRGSGFRPGDHALGIHIPRGAPLAPEACDSSFEWARAFFARHFPSELCRLAICTSWLLDEQLADYLPEDSNIVRFQRRFEIVPGAADGDGDVMRFVFGRVAPVLEELPQGTALQRAIVRHLRAGRHWRTRTGWLEV